MPNEYEVNVIITKHPTHWAWEWKVEYLGLSIESGIAVNLESALRHSRMRSTEAGYEVGRWCFVERFVDDDGLHYIYGADDKHSIRSIMSSVWCLSVLVTLFLLLIHLCNMLF